MLCPANSCRYSVSRNSSPAGEIVFNYLLFVVECCCKSVLFVFSSSVEFHAVQGRAIDSNDPNF
jgi:hypothetical protein